MEFVQLLFGMPGPQEILLILLILLLVFGASRLPEIGKSLGKGIREFKKATKGMTSDDEDDNENKKQSS